MAAVGANGKSMAKDARWLAVAVESGAGVFLPHFKILEDAPVSSRVHPAGFVLRWACPQLFTAACLA
jgi:hypothetical protein